MAGVFVATFILFALIHLPRNRQTLPDPRDISKQKNIRYFPEAITEAFEANSRNVWASQKINTALLALVSVQVLAFLGVTLGELFTR